MPSLLSTLFLRRAPTPPPPSIIFPFTPASNPYRAKKPWPPDFSSLSRKHQFRLERRYRRRTKLKWARPTWNKIVKLGQWGSILFVGVYGVLYLEMGKAAEGQETPFDGVRAWYRGWMDDWAGVRGGKEGAVGRAVGEGAGVEQKG